MFKSRCATLGFNDDANLEEGAMWPTSFALTELTAAEEARITALLAKAVSCGPVPSRRSKGEAVHGIGLPHAPRRAAWRRR